MKWLSAAAFAASVFVSLLNVAPAQAVEPDTIYSPRVEQGEWELEYVGRYFHDRDSDEHRQSQNKLALGYGPASYWWTELYAEYEHTPGSGGGWSAFEWENRFQLTEPGQYWIDVGALVELERTHPGGGKEVRAGLLLEKDIDETTLTVNWLLSRAFADYDASSLDYILIDCPPSLGLLTVNALVAAAEVLIPIQCEYYALEGLEQLLRTIDLVKSHLNPTLYVSTILLTMYDGRTRLASQVAEEVREHFGEVVLSTVIPRSVRVSEAPSYGQSVMTYDPGSSGAQAYLEAAREVADRAAELGQTG